MKLLSSLLIVLCLSAAACTYSPHDRTAAAPALETSVAHNPINVGETTQVVASTSNLAGGSKIQWSVSPSNARMTASKDNSQMMLFSADQPGTYIVRATARAQSGETVTSEKPITVNGMASNR